MKREIKILLLVFIILVFIKILLAYFIPAPSAFGDSYSYSKIARSLFHEGSFSIHTTPFYYHNPLYPFFLLPSYLFENMIFVYFFMKVINSIISTLIIFPIYFLAKDFLRYKKALFISILISLIAPFFIFSNHIMSENLFYPLVIFIIYFLYIGFKNNQKKYFILSGLFLGLIYLTKTLGVALIPLCFISYFFFRNKTKFKNIIYHYIIALLIASPWIIKKLTVDFSINSLIGSYRYTSSYLSSNLSTTIPTFINWFILYAGYLIIASGIFFGFYFISSRKLEDKNFRILYILTCIATFFFLLLCANHSTTSYISYPSPFKFFSYRPLGRYIETLLPLIILIGFIGYNLKKDILTKKDLVITSIITGISTQLIIAPLFPVNNQAVTLLGLFQHIFDFLIFNKSLFLQQFNWITFLVVSLLLILACIFIYFFKNKKLILFFITILLLINTLACYSITKYEADVWDNHEQVQLGKWFNSYDKKTSTILFDERDCEAIITIKNDNNVGICETTTFLTDDNIPENKKLFTLAGFWMNDNIIVDKPDNLTNVDYVISRHKLDLKIIKETETGIYVYQVNH